MARRKNRSEKFEDTQNLGITAPASSITFMFPLLKEAQVLRRMDRDDWHRFRMLVATVYSEVYYKFALISWAVVHYLMVFQQLIEMKKKSTFMDHLLLFCDITRMDLNQPIVSLGIDPLYIRKDNAREGFYPIVFLAVVVVVMVMMLYLNYLDHSSDEKKHRDILSVEGQPCSALCHFFGPASIFFMIAAVSMSCFTTYRVHVQRPSYEFVRMIMKSIGSKVHYHYWYIAAIVPGVGVYRFSILVHRHLAMTVYARKMGILAKSSMARLKVVYIFEAVIVLLCLVDLNLSGLIVFLVVGDMWTQVVHKGRHAFKVFAVYRQWRRFCVPKSHPRLSR